VITKDDNFSLLQTNASSPAPDSLVGINTLAQWTVRQMLLGTLTVFGVALGFLLLYRFYMVVFLFFVAFSLTVALDPAVNWLYRRRIRKEIGVLLIYLLLFLLISALVWLIAPTLIEQVRTVLQDLPGYYSTARDYLVSSRIGLVRGVARTLPQALSLPQLVASASGDPANAEASTWTSVWFGLRTFFAFIAVFIMAFYWTLEGEVIVRRFVLQVNPERREGLRELIDEVNQKIGGYFRGQIILCLIVGGLSLVAFWLIGVPNAITLGLLMGIFEAIPVLGPTLGAIPAILMALATAPETTLWVVIALVAIQVIENNLLVPRIMDQSVGVNAVVSMLAITAFGVLFGIVGAILAIPLAAIVQILMGRLLFDAPANEESGAGMPAAAEVSRSHTGVLRLEARELAQAVRRQARAPEEEDDNGLENDEEADEVEAIALELEHYLAYQESKA
jgi:predicted PurR-regulated permease PerM